MIGALLARKGLAAAFRALNGHDLDKFMVAWSDDGVFEFPGDIPESGTIGGREHEDAILPAHGDTVGRGVGAGVGELAVYAGAALGSAPSQIRAVRRAR
jgi:ketosteroid isomerase-like protein